MRNPAPAPTTLHRRTVSSLTVGRRRLHPSHRSRLVPAIALCDSLRAGWPTSRRPQHSVIRHAGRHSALPPSRTSRPSSMAA